VPAAVSIGFVTSARTGPSARPDNNLSNAVRSFSGRLSDVRATNIGMTWRDRGYFACTTIRHPSGVITYPITGSVRSRARGSNGDDSFHVVRLVYVIFVFRRRTDDNASRRSQRETSVQTTVQPTAVLVLPWWRAVVQPLDRQVSASRSWPDGKNWEKIARNH